jgi:hypothetical protein
VFCSFLYRQNAFQCMHNAKLAMATNPGPQSGQEEGIELDDMTGWREVREKRAEDRDRTGSVGGGGGSGACSPTASVASYAGSESGISNGDNDGGSGGGGLCRHDSFGAVHGGSSGHRGDIGDRPLKRSKSAPHTPLHACMAVHADAVTVLSRGIPHHTPPHVYYTLCDAKVWGTLDSEP